MGQPTSQDLEQIPPVLCNPHEFTSMGMQDLGNASSPPKQTGGVSTPQYPSHPSSLNDARQRRSYKSKHIRRMFFDIPRVRNMIAAGQMNFIGKVVRGPHDPPAQHMLTACCNNVWLTGRPFLHNKDHIVKNLCLLFAKVPEVTIDDYGSLSSWIRKASHAQYWDQLVACLTDRHATCPPHPTKWPGTRQSPRNHDTSNPSQCAFPPTPPHTHRTGRNDPSNPPDPQQQPELEPDIPSPPCCRRPPPPQPLPRSSNKRDYIQENVGHAIYDSLKILGLGLGASERDVKSAYRNLARIYHPDKWEESHYITGMSLAETTAHFQLLNNAQSHLHQAL